MLQAARKAAPSLLRQGAALGSTPARQYAAAAPQRPQDTPAEEEDPEAFELLPPGCSLKDPTYGRSFGGAGRNR